MSSQRNQQILLRKHNNQASRTQFRGVTVNPATVMVYESKFVGTKQKKPKFLNRIFEKKVFPKHLLTLWQSISYSEATSVFSCVDLA